MITAGGAIVEVLSTKAGAAATTKADLDAWIGAVDLNVTAMIDAPESPQLSLMTLGVRETVVIVEIPSMVIVWKKNGDITGLTPSSINDATTEILRLLSL